ncbi:MAG TPA: aminotransferase class V-fold PLP-dependent enzyme [Gaiellaceae bacterium]
MIDLARVRADTPGCLERVFLDSAGSSLPPEPVVRAVSDHLRREAEVGGYVAEEERADDLAGLRASLGRLLRCPPESVALMDSATRAWAQFFYAVPLAPGDRILLSRAEYASNAIAALQRARRHGARVDVVPATSTGELDLDALADLVDERVRLVSLVHVPTNGGLVNPVREATELVHEVGGLVLLDACQSVGQLDLDVQALGVDALTGTGRKWLRGPRGTGFLHVRPDLIRELEPPVLDLHSATWVADDRYEPRDDATRFELWESDVAGELGLKAAVDYALELGMDAVEAEVKARADRLRSLLAELPSVTVTDLGRERCGIVSFAVDDVPAPAVRDALSGRAIIVTVSERSSTLLDMSDRSLESLVRASPHYFVSDEQLEEAARAVAAL